MPLVFYGFEFMDNLENDFLTFTGVGVICVYFGSRAVYLSVCIGLGGAINVGARVAPLGNVCCAGCRYRICGSCNSYPMDNKIMD